MSTRSYHRASAIVLASLALSGCASFGGKERREHVDVVGHTETAGMDPIATAAFWGTRYDRNPTDPKVAVSFSKALRAVENNKESLRVIQHANTRIQDNADVLLETGKSLISNDRAHEAVRPIRRAIALGAGEDWTAYSALGVAYDKIGQHKDARREYDRALGLAPNKSQILNNKGLSYALQGERSMAERTLRTAVTMPGGTARIRQNFALVLALSGNTTEAERLARSDLPPAIANQNVAYYKQLVSQPAYWQDLSSADVDLPDFGDDPSTVSTTPRATPIPDPTPNPTPGRIKRAPKPVPTPAKPQPSGNVSASAAGKPATIALAADKEPVKLAFDESTPN